MGAGAGGGSYNIDEDAEFQEEVADTAYYSSAGNNITVRISATRKGAREVSDTTGQAGGGLGQAGEGVG